MSANSTVEWTPPKYVFYYYDPSVPAAAIFTAIFFISSAVHAFQIIRKRTWYFIPLLIGALRIPPFPAP